MPEPKNKTEQVRGWLSNIAIAEKLRDRISARYRWKELIRETKGNFLLSQGQMDIQVNPLNYPFAYVKTEIPSLYLRDPHIKINPKRDSSIESAKILELALNYLWRNKKLKREIKKSILDGLTVGHSWFKTGYTGKFGTVEDGNGNTIETILNEDFFGYRTPWDAIIFNPESVDPPFDSMWIGHKVWAPLDDVKANKKYKNTEHLQASPRDLPTDENYSQPHVDSEDKYPTNTLYTCIYEIWNTKKREVFTIAQGVDDYLEDPKRWPYEMQGYPFSYLCFNPVNDEPYGLPDLYMIEPQIMEMMKMRAAQLDHVKRYNRQIVTEPNNFTQESKDALQLAITGAVLEAKNPGAIFPLPYPPLPNDAYALEERLKEDLINISGQTAADRGGFQKTTTRTFKELLEIQKGAENRRSERVDVVEDFIEEIAMNLVSLLQQFADVPYFVRVTGVDAMDLQQIIQGRPSAQIQGSAQGPAGFTFTKEDIQGEYDIDVVAGSTTPLDRQNKIQILTETLKLLPAVGAIPGGPVVGTVGRMLAEEFDMPELIRAMNEEVELQAKLKEENQKRQEEIENLQLATLASDKEIQSQKVATNQSRVVMKALSDQQQNELKEKELVIKAAESLRNGKEKKK